MRKRERVGEGQKKKERVIRERVRGEQIFLTEMYILTYSYGKKEKCTQGRSVETPKTDRGKK